MTIAAALAGSGFLNATSLVVRSPSLHQSPTFQPMPSAGAPALVPPPVAIAAAAPRKTCAWMGGRGRSAWGVGTNAFDRSAAGHEADG